MPNEKGFPTKAERDERVTVEADIDPREFLAGLLEVDPEQLPKDEDQVESD